MKTDVGAVIASYTYGDSNERLITDESGYRTYYCSQGGTVIAEYSETPALPTTPKWSKSYVYLGGRLLSTLTPNGSGGEAVNYHHPDRLGTRVVTDPVAGTSFEQLTLSFGTALGAESPGAPDKRFTSYDNSDTSKLDYAVNRHYDSQQGRFTQTDPIGMGGANTRDPQSLNSYAYVLNDPTNFVDPTGFYRICWGGWYLGDGQYAPMVCFDFPEFFPEEPKQGGNQVPNVNGFEDRIKKLKPECATFIKNLINQTATTKNPAQFTDALTGFNMIMTQGGFVYGDTIKKAYGFEGGTVHGSIAKTTAQVELPVPAEFHSIGPVNQRAASDFAAMQRITDFWNSLHEILHFAGKNGYDDFAYANTVAAMAGDKPPDYSGMKYSDAVRKASDYWNHALLEACKPAGASK